MRGRAACAPWSAAGTIEAIRRLSNLMVFVCTIEK
jgi:hypothetical protein